MITFYGLRKVPYGGHYIEDFTRAGHEVVKFPAGEAHINMGHITKGTIQIAHVQGCGHDDLFSLAMWADACKRANCKTAIMLPYLPGARADRGSPLGAKVYADFINGMHVDCVVCVDGHSAVAPALYKQLVALPLDSLDCWNNFPHYGGVIAPDIGARARAESVAAKLKLPVYQAMKHRDFATGKLSGFSCETIPAMQPMLVVDDICDGGGTFLGLADVLKLPRNVLGLWVTHGVFSNFAFPRLFERYGHVYTTDSFVQDEQLDYKTYSLFTPMLNAIKERLL